MGPFPHDAPPPLISDHNPMGTDGFAFVEFADPEPARLDAQLRLMGFVPIARHRTKAIIVYRQGDITILANAEPGSHAAAFAAAHGPSAPSMGFRVVDAGHAYERALALGAEPADPAGGSPVLDVPAIKGIGGSLLYFVDRYGMKGCMLTGHFVWTGALDPQPEGMGLRYLDHLTHNVHRGRMGVWAEFYQRLFNFREIRFFKIDGEYTGLHSQALTSPDGKIRIPINESADAHSQIEEYLRVYQGEGIQHIAFGCRDIYATVERLRTAGLPFMPPPPGAYYAEIDARVPSHGEDLARLAGNGILIDGEGVGDGGTTKVLLQLFSANAVGPIFFEFIQRKGDEGFGEGNFRALFLSIEEDQRRRGVLGPAGAAP